MSARFFRRISDAAGVLAGSAKVEVLRPGINTSGQAAHVAIFADAALTLPLANPYVSSTATAEFYTADPQRVRLVVALVNGTVYDDIVDTWPSEPLVRAPATLRVPPAVAGKFLVGTAPGVVGWGDFPVTPTSPPPDPMPDFKATWTRRIPTSTYDDVTVRFLATDKNEPYLSLLLYQDTNGGYFYFSLDRENTPALGERYNLFAFSQSDSGAPDISALSDLAAVAAAGYPANPDYVDLPSSTASRIPLSTGADQFELSVSDSHQLLLKRNGQLLWNFGVLPQDLLGTHYEIQFYDGGTDVTDQVMHTASGTSNPTSPIPDGLSSLDQTFYENVDFTGRSITVRVHYIPGSFDQLTFQHTPGGYGYGVQSDSTYYVECVSAGPLVLQYTSDDGTPIGGAYTLYPGQRQALFMPAIYSLAPEDGYHVERYQVGTPDWVSPIELLLANTGPVSVIN